MFVIEKNTGKVHLVQNGAIVATVLDLPVHNTYSRGLLSIVLHPNFHENGYVYLYYSRSNTGSDTTSGSAWQDNRVERYRWNGTALVEPTLIVAFTPDPTQPSSTRHNGGVMTFGADGMLYIATGDLDRGTFANGRIEQNTHETQVAGVGGIVRLTDNGTIPPDNPFISHPDPRIKHLWAYGIRNSFGITFDSLSHQLWITDNGPECCDEVNRIERGFNGGWRKIMGPDARNYLYADNNNRNWDARDLIYLPNAYYGDPAFTWQATVAPTSIVFLRSARFPADLRDHALVGDAWGAISRFRPNATRTGFLFTGGLADTVADNSSERGALVWSDGWGIPTDFKIGPDGYLYICTYEGSSSVPPGIRRVRPVNSPEIL
ncbi:MAG: PQQ-dependent sugar dehydrogenase, partial [Fimbriimonadales bacterium]|nr:PQQ-dependent sugar dehydrogenase [Fimbriimonadales bacterium]